MVYLSGALMFVTGLAVVRAHNLWVRNWTVLVTLTGWFFLLLGLLRMFAALIPGINPDLRRRHANGVHGAGGRPAGHCPHVTLLSRIPSRSPPDPARERVRGAAQEGVIGTQAGERVDAGA